MTKTLAELRAMSAPKLPTRSERLCLNLELIARVQALTDERVDLVLAAEAEAKRSAEAADGAELDEAARESLARTRKAAQGGPVALPPRADEINAELTALWAEMAEYEGDLTLRGIDGGRWQDYKDAHPPREGNKSDEDYGYGLVNTTDLMADLGDFAVAWNGEDLADGDWRGWLAGRVAPADLSGLVRRVVEMHESKVAIPKGLSGSPATTSSESAGA